jgi:hypothetical protein
MNPTEHRAEDALQMACSPRKLQSLRCGQLGIPELHMPPKDATVAQHSHTGLQLDGYELFSLQLVQPLSGKIRSPSTIDHPLSASPQTPSLGLLHSKEASDSRLKQDYR